MKKVIIRYHQYFNGEARWVLDTEKEGVRICESRTFANLAAARRSARALFFNPAPFSRIIEEYNPITIP